MSVNNDNNQNNDLNNTAKPHNSDNYQNNIKLSEKSKSESTRRNIERVVISFITIGSLAIGLLGGLVMGQLLYGFDENDYIAKNLVKEYGIKYNVSTAFLRQLFPDQVVYLDDGQVTFTDIDPELELNDYDWNNLIIGDDGVYDYVVDGVSLVAHGIDISKFQGDIDWSAVAASGIDFAMMRVGYRGYSEGQIYVDDYFHANAQSAEANGIAVGAYFFSQAITVDEAVEEAEFVLNEIKDYDITYPIVFDMENISGTDQRTDGLTKDEITAITLAFCDTIRDAGYTPMIYGNSHSFFSSLDLEAIQDYAKWYAQYSSEPYYPYVFTMWQYSNTGTVAGIDGEVDLNISFVDYSE